MAGAGRIFDLFVRHAENLIVSVRIREMVLKMSTRKRILCMGAGLSGLVVLAVSSAKADRVDFARDIAPIFERHCIQCHNPGNEKSDVSLATREPLLRGEFVVPGEPDESELLALVVPRSDGKRPRMPKKGSPLRTEQVGLLRQWIAQGADWPKGLVLHEPAKPHKNELRGRLTPR